MGKKSVSLLVLLLVVCLALPAYGAGTGPVNVKEPVMETAASSSADDVPKDVKISQEKAIEILKGFFEVPEDFRPEVYLNGEWQPGNRRVWAINFYKPYFSIYAVVDADSGEIISYNSNEDWLNPYGRRKAFLARYTREEARVFTENFIKKIAPDKFSKVSFVEENYYPGLKAGGLFEPVYYYFRFAKSGENIKPIDYYYGEEGINVTVNAANGQVTSYNLNWSEGKPIDEKTISKQKAEEIYAKYLGPELAYVRGYDQEKGVPYDFAKLMYVPQRFGYTGLPLTIRAKDGALISYAGGEVKQVPSLTEIDFSGAKTITPIKLKTPLTKQQAQKLAEEEIKKFDLDNLVLQSFETPDLKAQDLYFFNFNSAEGNGVNANVAVDATAGKIQSFGFWKNTGPYYPEAQSNQDSDAIGWEDAKNVALEYIKKYLPDKADQVRSIDYSQEINPIFKEPYQPYYFNFTRMVNGIPYMGNNIYAGIDREGQIINFNYNWDDITFPAPEKNMLSRDKAAELVLSKMGITLAYIMPKMYGYYGPDTPQKPEQPEKILVYTLKSVPDAAYIDAYTGEVLNYALKKPGTVNTSSPAVTINGETGRREAELLMNQGIFEAGSKIDLESVPTVKETVKFFASCLGLGARMYVQYETKTGEQTDPDEKYVDAALEQGLMTPDEVASLYKPLDRQQLAKLAVRFMGYDALAAKDEIFKLDVGDSRDIEKGLDGYVSSALALGIMEKSGDSFLPKDKVKFGDMVKVLYKAAELLR